ncbi:MAG: 3-oxo-5-alpha-steroid 4-dehydrogenase [Marinilabiliales bacterium]|nr:MAG: 3-oxo-5-alpha-steroid 4-dehydrogenase [Marinilabiliales bacterium]
MLFLGMISEDTFNYLLYAWIALAFIVFPILLRITAPYGRHTTNTWGPTINNRLGWVLMELPVIVVFSYFLFRNDNNLSYPVLVFYALFMLHYFNRVFIFPFRIKTNGKQIPISIIVLALFFNISNGFFNGYWLSENSQLYDNSWFYDPRFIIGIILFFTGMAINIKADNKLFSLRKGGKKGYFIPRGWLFKYISSPNLFGEIIEWTGWAILCWCLPSFSFALWTFANLVPRAIDHHRWYKRRFDDYPANRKAVFPYLV